MGANTPILSNASRHSIVPNNPKNDKGKYAGGNSPLNAILVPSPIISLKLVVKSDNVLLLIMPFVGCRPSANDVGISTELSVNGKGIISSGPGTM